MKSIQYIICSCMLLLAMGCGKQELSQPETPAVVKLLITGSATVDLEFVYRDSVVATSIAANGGFVITQLLATGDGNAEVVIRKKDTKEVIGAKAISSMPFDQSISIYYDGEQLYDKAVLLAIKGYALEGELEFLVDGNVIYSGSNVIAASNLRVLINNNATKELQVRKKGQTDIVLTKTIVADQERQSLNFFFDGSRMVSNVQLTPPANPANMMISAKFQSLFTDYFKNVDVDVVFFQRHKTTGATQTISPELRFTLPVSGAFNNIELPPLADPANYVYAFDIYEKGTNTVPYKTTTAPFIQATFPFQQNLGRFGSQIDFKAGGSALLLIKDTKTVRGTPTRFTVMTGTITDLSEYFQ